MAKLRITEEKYEGIPAIGAIVGMDRPEDVAYLPALYMEMDEAAGREKLMTVYQSQDKMAWFTFEGGPSINTFLTELENDLRRPRLLLLDSAFGYKVLGTVLKLNEWSAAFVVTASAPNERYDELLQLDGLAGGDKLRQQQQVLLQQASNWHHYGRADISVSRSGHNLHYEFNAVHGYVLREVVTLANELYEKLPSGSGFDNGWNLHFGEKHIEASTYFSPMNEDGFYCDNIALTYDLRKYQVEGWQIQDTTDRKQELDEVLDGSWDETSYDACEETLLEALRHD